MKHMRRYATSKEFDKAVDDYVETCKISGEKVTLTGLCLHMGFTSRASLDSYSKNAEFTSSVQRARLLVEHSYEQDLRQKGLSPVSSIFALKNFGWQDKVENQHTADEDFIDMVFKVSERRNKAKTD